MGNYKVVIVENVISDLKKIEQVFNENSNFLVYKKFESYNSFINFMKYNNSKIDFLVINIFINEKNPFEILKEVNHYKNYINKVICCASFVSSEIFSCLNEKKRTGDWNANYYYGISTSNKGKASDCIQCGKCEKLCPQFLPIRELLKLAKETFDK